MLSLAEINAHAGSSWPFLVIIILEQHSLEVEADKKIGDLDPD